MIVESTARAVRGLFACLALLALPALAAPPTIPSFGYEVVRSYPHDPNAFTEGLFFKNGVMYESTGLEGRILGPLAEAPKGDDRALHRAKPVE